MSKLDELLKMIEDFLNGQYEALPFSYDAPDFLFDNYDEIESVNNKAGKYLNDELPDICDIYERGDDPTELKEKISKMYEKVKKMI